MGRNFDDYPSFQPKTAPAQRYATQCMSLLWKLALELTSKTQFIIETCLFFKNCHFGSVYKQDIFTNQGILVLVI